MGTIYLYTINKQILTLGNYINMDIYGEITGDFATYVTTIDPMYMQEYGHTIDSRAWVPAFLFGVGLPSLISSGSQHQVDGEPQVVYMQRFRVYEMRANRKAAKYFGGIMSPEFRTAN